MADVTFDAQTAPANGKARKAGRAERIVVIEGGAARDPYVRSLPRYVDDLDRQFPRVYEEEMVKDDQVASVVRGFVRAVLAEGVRVLPAVDDDRDPDFDAAKKEAAFCERVVADLGRRFEETVEALVMAAPLLGHRLAEVTTEPVESGPWAGRDTVRHFKTKPPSSYSFLADRFMNVPGVLARTGAGYGPSWQGGPADLAALRLQPNFVPRDKLVVLSWRPQDGDPRGSSDGRALYDAWYSKRQACVDLALLIRQWGRPSTWATLGEGQAPSKPTDDLGNPTGAEQSDAMGGLVQALMRFSEGGVLGLPFGSKVGLLQPTGKVAEMLAALAYHDQRIARVVLGTAFGGVGEARRNSKAAAETGQDVTGNHVRHVKRVVGAMLAEELFYPLLVANVGRERADALCPKVSLQPVEHQDWQTIAVVPALAQAASESQVQYVLQQQYGLPPPTEEEVAQKQAQAQQQGGFPGAPPGEGGGAPPDTQPPGPGGPTPPGAPPRGQDDFSDLLGAAFALGLRGEAAFRSAKKPPGEYVDAATRRYCVGDRGRVPCPPREKPARAKPPKASPDDAERLARQVMASPDAESVKALGDALAGLTVAQLKEVRGRLGLTGGRTKSDIQQRITTEAARRVKERERVAREARAAGVRPGDVYAEARVVRQTANEYVDTVGQMLRETRAGYRAEQGKGLTRNHPAFRGGDPAGLPGFDALARTMAGRYPELLGAHGYEASGESDLAARRLYDFLLAGAPPRMTYPEAYAEALEHLKSLPPEQRPKRGQKAQAMTWDDVPFARKRGKDAPGQGNLFDPARHPHQPAGSPQGGQFAPKGGGGTAAAPAPPHGLSPGDWEDLQRIARADGLTPEQTEEAARLARVVATMRREPMSAAAIYAAVATVKESAAAVAAGTVAQPTWQTLIGGGKESVASQGSLFGPQMGQDVRPAEPLKHADLPGQKTFAEPEKVAEPAAEPASREPTPKEESLYRSAPWSLTREQFEVVSASKDLAVEPSRAGRYSEAAQSLRLGRLYAVADHVSGRTVYAYLSGLSQHLSSLGTGDIVEVADLTWAGFGPRAPSRAGVTSLRPAGHEEVVAAAKAAGLIPKDTANG